MYLQSCGQGVDYKVSDAWNLKSVVNYITIFISGLTCGGSGEREGYPDLRQVIEEVLKLRSSSNLMGIRRQGQL